MQQSVFVLNAVNSVANHIFFELRHRKHQLNRGNFRRNLVKLGQIMAYELSKSLQYHPVDVETVLGRSSINVIQQPPVFFTIIRAGVPFLEGFQSYFEESDCGFIAAQRVEGNKEDIKIDLHYSSIPPFENRDLVVVDPMLATGKSLLASLERILTQGTPRMLHLACAIAAPEGIENIQSNLKIPCKLWVGAIDKELNSKGYIVPGLGDVGDLLYGDKI